jgi:hypothetical protein
MPFFVLLLLAALGANLTPVASADISADADDADFSHACALLEQLL